MVSKTIRVSGLQMLVSRDVTQNESRILKAIESAAEQESDILLTPEGSLSGHHQRNRAFHESSVDLWAHALGMPIVEVNALEDSDKPINASSGLVGPDGTRILVVPDIGERLFTCDITL